MDAAKYFILTTLVGPTNLYHLKSNPTLTKTFLTKKMQQRATFTKPSKNNGEVVTFNPFAKVKTLHRVSATANATA
jgi:hypothetical protein